MLTYRVFVVFFNDPISRLVHAIRLYIMSLRMRSSLEVSIQLNYCSNVKTFKSGRNTLRSNVLGFDAVEVM